MKYKINRIFRDSFRMERPGIWVPLPNSFTHSQNQYLFKFCSPLNSSCNFDTHQTAKELDNSEALVTILSINYHFYTLVNYRESIQTNILPLLWFSCFQVGSTGLFVYTRFQRKGAVNIRHLLLLVWCNEENIENFGILSHLSSLENMEPELFPYMGWVRV